ncbi:Tetratricopeptide-like helical [Globisporangium polare]
MAIWSKTITRAAALHANASRSTSAGVCSRAARLSAAANGGRIAARALSTDAGTSSGTLAHNMADTKIGIGYLQLTPEEIQAEQELLQFLPEFQQATKILHGADDEFAALTNWKRASLAIPQLERTVEICRSSMGFQSVYLLAALRHLFLTYFMQGNYAMANKVMHERGELMSWPMYEQERMLRLFLRENTPEEALAWCQKEVFTSLFPKDETMPLRWTIYELISKSLRDGVDDSGFDVSDPLFTKAVEVLRCKKDLVAEKGGAAVDDSLLSRDIPYLMSQYASLSLVSSGALSALASDNNSELSEQQHVALDQAEMLWREALTWVEQTVGDDNKEELITGVDAPFEAWTQTNLGELLLRKKKPEEAMEHLGKALKIQQQEKGGQSLALSRILGKIAVGCHAVGQAVSAEGLLTTAVEAFEREKFLSITDQVEYARVLRAYGDLLQNWEKREGGAKQKYAQAEAIEKQVELLCREQNSRAPLQPVFYLPL